MPCMCQETLRIEVTFADGPRTLSSTSGWRAATAATATASRRGVLCTATSPWLSRRRASSAGTRSLHSPEPHYKPRGHCPACAPVLQYKTHTAPACIWKRPWG